jgi:micrococcal nuclease
MWRGGGWIVLGEQSEIANKMTPSRCAIAVAILLFASVSTGALADPCKAIPDKGPMPAFLKPGSTFSGPVTYVGDGDSLCVAVGPSTADWVEVRVSDFYAPELQEPSGQDAKTALERIAKGRRVECRAIRQSYDRVVARCAFQGRSLGDLMRSAGVREGGNGRSD